MLLHYYSKHCLRLAFCIVLISSLASCKEKQSTKGNDTASAEEKPQEKVSNKPGSGGKTCEILAVCEQNFYKKGVEDTLKAFFMSMQAGINQGEPLFTVANVQHKAFTGSSMFRKHRNVIGVEINSQITKPSLSMNIDNWSSPQVVFWFKVASIRQFDSLFSYSKAYMLAAFYKKEYERMQKVFKKTENTDISTCLKKNYGFSIVFPEGFQIASMRSDFAWVRKESKYFGQGIIISIYPYKDKSVFENKNIIQKRNTVVSRIPGPAKGSYMTTETTYPEFYPSSKSIDFNGLYAIETRGLWKLCGDFMGGPFVNYTFVDTANNRVIMLDAYIYSPKKPKRDVLMQMEGMARSFAFEKPKNNASK